MTTRGAITSEQPQTSLSASSSLALDQWRGLALILVLISHGLYFTGRTDGIGRVGVNLFFFISGILVFRSLDRVTNKSAAQLCSDFWSRRLKRLYPALLGYVLLMIPLTYLLQDVPGQKFNQDFPTFLSRTWVALAFLVNYITQKIPESLYHLWSVSCEMQFYLLAPLIFLLGGRSRTRRTVVWAIFLIALLAGGLTAPVLMRNLPPEDPRQGMKYQFQFAVWPMMLGFFVEAHSQWFARRVRPMGRLLMWGGLFVLLIAMALMFAGHLPKMVVVGIGALMILPCYAGYAANCPLPGPVGSALAWIGERTYSIYLWQQPLTISDYLPRFWRPLGAAVSVFVGAIWFKLLEVPFMSRRKAK